MEKEVPEGAKVTLKADRDEYLIGEKVFAEFVVENVGKTPFRVGWGGDQRFASRPLRFKVTAKDQDGKEAEDPLPSQLSCGGFAGDREIKPGEKSVQTLVLLRYFDIKEAGRYTIRATHDFGWKEEGRKRPVAETVLTFRMPGPEEAARIVTRMAQGKTKERSVGTMVMTDEADFQTLRLPVYLKPLLKLAEKRDLRALEGIASIPTLEATDALIRLASEFEGDFALEAARRVIVRLPLREDEMQSGFYSEPRYPGAWDPALRPKVGRLARKLLASKNAEEIRVGAILIQSVASPDDGPAVIVALDRTLEGGRAERKNEDYVLFSSGTPLIDLLGAVRALNRSGFDPGDSPSGNGAILAYFNQFIGVPGPRPEHWQKNLEVLGWNHFWAVREAALRSIPRPMPPECASFVRKAMDDQDKGVCRVACEVAGGSGDKAFITPLMEIVRTENHEGLWTPACNALRSLGVDYDLLVASAERLGDENLCRYAIENLKTVVDAGEGGYYFRLVTARGARLELRKQWQEFLAKHGEELRNGKRFKLGDPALVPSLFSPAYQFRPKDGPAWPPEEGPGHP